MTDPKHPHDSTNAEHGPNRGQTYGGQRGETSGDGHHNQSAAVRGAGDQNPSDTYRSDIDRENEVRPEER